MSCKHGLGIKIALFVMVSVFAPNVVARAAERLTSVGERLQRSDATIKADIARTLRADRSLGDSRIIVKSVRNGVVVLSGNAASLNDYVRALRLTADRRGVRKVFSEIDAYDADRSSTNRASSRRAPIDGEHEEIPCERGLHPLTA